MNFLTINLTTTCDNNCEYCPISEKWRNRPENNKLTNDALFKYLDKYITSESDEWIIELTGGEPALYEGINGLVEGLTDRGFWGVVKTNGQRSIRKTTNFQIISAWHANQEELPKYYDQILIIKNPNDDWQKKVDYCEKKKIPYGLVEYSPTKEDREKGMVDTYTYPSLFLKIAHIHTSGEITPLAGTPINRNINIFNALTDDNPLIDYFPYEFCIGVNYKPAADAFIFLSEKLQKKIKDDYLKIDSSGGFVGGEEVPICDFKKKVPIKIAIEEPIIEQGEDIA
jgi:molybdenum cofactor biosynthesis enzyme MoaA